MVIDVNESISGVSVTGVQNLPDGEHIVQVSSFDGLDSYGSYNVNFVNGSAIFGVKCNPLQYVRCNILTGDYPATKSVTFTGKSGLATYANSPVITENNLLPQNIIKIDGINYTMGQVYTLPNGVSLTFSTRGCVSIMPRGIGDHLNPGEVLSFSIPITYEDDSREDIECFVLASEEVGPNLASSNADTHTVSLTEGKVYEIAFTSSGSLEGSIHPEIVGDTTANPDYVLSENNREVWHLRAPANAGTINLVRADNHAGSITNLHIREVLSDEGNVTDVEYFSVKGGTEEVTVNWVPKPVAGFLSDVEPHDEYLTGQLNTGTWYQDEDENWVLNFNPGERMVSNSQLTRPAGDSFSITLVYGFDPSSYGRPLGNKDGKYSQIVIDPFNRKFVFTDGDSVSFPFNLPVYDFLALNTYELECNDTGTVTLYLNGSPVGTLENCLAQFVFNRINATDDVSATSQAAYSEIKIEYGGSLVAHFSANGSDRTVNPPVFGDISGTNKVTEARNMTLVTAAPDAYIDYVGVQNLKAHKVTVSARRQGIRREAGARESVTGYTEVIGSTFIGGYTGSGDDAQRGVVLGSNDTSTGVVMFAGNYSDMKQEANNTGYTDGNSDSLLMNSTSGDARHFSHAFTFANYLKGASDGQQDYKISNDMESNTLIGGLSPVRMHIASVTRIGNTVLKRKADSRSAINVNYPISRCMLFNVWIDDVRAMDAQQLVNFANPNPDPRYTDGALYGWSDTTPAAGLVKQVYVAKSKLRHHPHCTFNLTDYELQYSDEGTGTWQSLELDGNHLQGILGAPRRTLSLPAGRYDFRLRARFGNREGYWSTVTGVEVV